MNLVETMKYKWKGHFIIRCIERGCVNSTQEANVLYDEIIFAIQNNMYDYVKPIGKTFVKFKTYSGVYYAVIKQKNPIYLVTVYDRKQFKTVFNS